MELSLNGSFIDFEKNCFAGCDIIVLFHFFLPIKGDDYIDAAAEFDHAKAFPALDGISLFKVTDNPPR